VTKTVNVRKCVPYQATRQVTKCVPCQEKVKVCKMVAREVEKEVCVSNACGSSCNNYAPACCTSSKHHFGGLKGKFGGHKCKASTCDSCCGAPAVAGAAAGCCH
jgi:hypothetical protein